MAQNQSQSDPGSPKKTNPLGPKWILVLAAILAGFLILSLINKTAPTPTAPPAAPLAPIGTEATPPATLPTDAWVGTWTGVEGLRIDIAKSAVKNDPNYKLHIFNMDGDAEYVGRPQGDVITFERAGKVETVKAGSGKDTGLKWLADKTNCLVIQPGEGFCRPEGTP